MSDLRRDAEPTIAEAERFIRKMEKCESMPAKLILLRNLLLRQREAGRLEGLREGCRIALLNGRDFNAEFPELYREFMAASEDEMDAHSLIAKAIEAKITEGRK